MARSGEEIIRPDGSTPAYNTPSPPKAKGSINLRVEAETRALIDKAASALGKTRTEFMVDSARQEAINVLIDQRLFQLDPDQFDAFRALLDTAPEPGPKLKSLLSRPRAWKA